MAEPSFSGLLVDVLVAGWRVEHERPVCVPGPCDRGEAPL